MNPDRSKLMNGNLSNSNPSNKPSLKAQNNDDNTPRKRARDDSEDIEKMVSRFKSELPPIRGLSGPNWSYKNNYFDVFMVGKRRGMNSDRHQVYAAYTTVDEGFTELALNMIPKGESCIIFSGTHGDKKGTVGAEDKDLLTDNNDNNKLVSFSREDNEIVRNRGICNTTKVVSAFNSSSKLTPWYARSYYTGEELDYAIQSGFFQGKHYQNVILAFCFSKERFDLALARGN